MSDDVDLEKLAAALKRAEPAPDPAKKADAMARAMAEFDRVQGSAERSRQMSDRPEEGAGFWTGVSAMLSKLTTRAALAGTASVAVVGVALIAIVPNLSDPLQTSEVRVAQPVVDVRAPEATAPAVTEAAPQVAQTEAPPPRPVAVPEPEAPQELAEAPVAADPSASMSSAAAAAPTPEVAATTDALSADDGSAPGRTEGAEPKVAGIAAAAGAEADLDRERRQSGEAMPEAEISGFVTEEARPVIPGVPSMASGGGFFGDTANQAGPGRIVVIPAPTDQAVVPPEPNTEAFPEAERNSLKVVAQEPVSTFSIDVDTASYGVVRSSLNAGYLPDPASVRIEEMVNYFPYDWPAPEAGEAPFRTTVSVMESPWNADTRLVTVALKGEMPAVEDRPALNLVFLIDTSGSMQDQNKLPLLIQSFRLMLAELRPEDQVAIVTYAGSAGMVLPPTPASERETISAALGNLQAGGSTAGQEGLAQAYALARKMQEDGEVTRVLLATDGDFNVGISDPDALKDYIATQRESDVYLSVLGFGRGNLDDATMQALAQNGNGTASYIDTLNEARKVLVDQLSGALFPIADDVKIQVEWNPATVAEYRLIGYETRALRREDFNNDRVDAGEIGAGHTVTAIYEITPVGSPAIRNTPLRYGEAAAETVAAPANEGELGFLRLRYKEPGEDVSNLIERPIFTDTSEGGQDAQFAAAIAGFGELLADDTYLGQWGWDEVIALANSAKGEDPFGYRAEAVNLMRLAQSLSR